MPSIRRHIRIEAPPEVVRHYLDDPALRRGWLDEEVELSPDEDGGRRYSSTDREVERHVRIDLVPEDGGTRVTVTESLGEEPDSPAGQIDDDDVVALHGQSLGRVLPGPEWPAEAEDHDDLHPRLLAA